MSEKWLPIEGYEFDYLISSYGRVKSIKYDRHKILKPGISGAGYKFVVLCLKGVVQMKQVHRLVAETFLNERSECVNHIDGDKTNNVVSNLEWCTYHENRIHANRLGLTPQRGTPKSAKITCPDGESIITETLMDVNRFFGFKKCWVQNRVFHHGNPFYYDGFRIEVM